MSPFFLSLLLGGCSCACVRKEGVWSHGERTRYEVMVFG